MKMAHSTNFPTAEKVSQHRDTKKTHLRVTVGEWGARRYGTIKKSQYVVNTLTFLCAVSTLCGLPVWSASRLMFRASPAEKEIVSLVHFNGFKWN